MRRKGWKRSEWFAASEHVRREGAIWMVIRRVGGEWTGWFCGEHVATGSSAQTVAAEVEDIASARLAKLAHELHADSWRGAP